MLRQVRAGRQRGLQRGGDEEGRDQQLEQEKPAHAQPLPRHVGLPVADLVRPQVKCGHDARRTADPQEIKRDDSRQCDREGGRGGDEERHPSRPRRRRVRCTMSSTGWSVVSLVNRSPRRRATCSIWSVRRARADRSGDLVLLVGADTGRDGIHGATFASVEMDERSTSRRPAVQVGNPFLEKLLCEACLRLNELDGVTAIQDLGAAGLTSAAAELAHRGRRGIDLDIAQVSRREHGMTGYDVMLSESQERMLVVVRPEAETAAREVFNHFELHADRVGSVTSNGRIRVRDGRSVEADIPLKALVDGVPSRSPAAEVPDKQPSLRMPAIEEPEAILLDLMARPNLRSRRPIYRTYDHQVQDNTVWGPGYDAALLRVPGTNNAAHHGCPQ